MKRKFTVYTKKISQFLKRQINRVRFYKTKVYRRCPNCGTHLCLPRKKGCHTVKCPICHGHFEIKL